MCTIPGPQDEPVAGVGGATFPKVTRVLVARSAAASIVPSARAAVCAGRRGRGVPLGFAYPTRNGNRLRCTLSKQSHTDLRRRRRPRRGGRGGMGGTSRWSVRYTFCGVGKVQVSALSAIGGSGLSSELTPQQLTSLNVANICSGISEASEATGAYRVGGAVGHVHDHVSSGGVAGSGRGEGARGGVGRGGYGGPGGVCAPWSGRQRQFSTRVDSPISFFLGT